MNTSIPQNIRRLRRQAGLTQEQLAEKLFVTRQTISLWELGKAKPDVDTLQAIADCFQTDLMTVLYGSSGRQGERDQLRKRLIWWGIISGGLWMLLSATLEWLDCFQRKTFSLAAGGVYSWLMVWGLPLLAAGSGASLAILLRPVTGKKRNQVWSWCVALVCTFFLAYYGWFWYAVPRHSLIPGLNRAILRLTMDVPWAFLFVGYGIGRKVGVNMIYQICRRITN